MRSAAWLLAFVFAACGRTEPVHHTDEPALDGGVDAGLDAGVCFPGSLRATLVITADNRRSVWLNGTPLEATQREWFEPSTLTVTLSRTVNVLAVQATNLTNQGGFDRGLLASFSWAGGGSFVTSREWKQRGVSDGGWNPDDPAWLEPTFDDSAWGAAVEQGGNGAAPWGPVLGVSSQARWVWSYDSSGPDFAKPQVEAVLFRHRFVVDSLCP